jgi:hypothetical protein
VNFLSDLGVFLLEKSMVHGISRLGKAFAYKKKNYEHMKQYASLWLCALALATTLTSCEVIGGIFKAGFWSAIIVVVVVVGLILWLVGRSRK